MEIGNFEISTLQSTCRVTVIQEDKSHHCVCVYTHTHTVLLYYRKKQNTYIHKYIQENRKLHGFCFLSIVNYDILVGQNKTIQVME